MIFRIILWILAIWFVSRIIRVFTQPRQQRPPNPKKTTANPSPPFRDVQDADFEDITDKK